MAIRGSKVGDVVSVSPMKGKTLHGTIITIDTQGVRCLATAEGYYYTVPDEMSRSAERDRTKRAADVAEGDVVVMFNGTPRTVESNVVTGSPPRHRITFVEQDKALGVFRQQTVLADERYYVID